VGAEFALNPQLKLAGSALPAMSVIPVVSVAVYWVPLTSEASGVQRATEPLALTVPATPAPPPVTVKVAAFTVAGAIASENEAWIVPFRAAPLAPAAGSVASTLGGILSDWGPVPLPESLQLRAATASTPTCNSLPTLFRPTARLVMIASPVMDRPGR
jgi:hypothetical protein